MGAGKQSAAGQAARRQKIFDYILEHGPVKSGMICSDLQMSRSSLSDDIRAINIQTPVIVSPRRGFYEYREPEGGDHVSLTVAQRLNRTYIRRWMILLLLSGRRMTVAELYEVLQRSACPCSTGTLYADLRILKQEQYIDTYSGTADDNMPYYQSFHLLSADREMIRNYLNVRKGSGAGHRVLIDAYENIDEKLAHCLTTGQIGFKETGVRRIGKLSMVSAEQLDLISAFQQHSYTSYALSVPLRTNCGRRVTTVFFVGMIVYSAETNRIYLMGKDQNLRNTIIPLDRIEIGGIKELRNVHNYYFDTPEYHRIFDEMFHLSTDHPVKVRVRFRNLPSVREKVERLCEIRPNANIEWINGDTEIRYTDTLRGLDDFSRYLRRFGRSAAAEEPAALREKMKATSRKTIALYEDG